MGQLLPDIRISHRNRFGAAAHVDLANFAGRRLVEHALQFQDIGDLPASHGGDDITLMDVLFAKGAVVADADDHDAGGGMIFLFGGRCPANGDGAEQHALPTEAAVFSGNGRTGELPAAELHLDIHHLALAIER